MNRLEAPDTEQFKYECTAQNGAVLVLNNYATCKVVEDDLLCRRYVARHYQSWCKYVEEAPDVRPVFVYGWRKTTPNWRATAFTSGSRRFMTSNYGITRWARGFRSTSSQETIFEGPTMSRTGLFEGAELPPDTKEDQCIFLKYYCAKYRRFWSPRVMRASSGPYQPPNGSGDHCGHGSSAVRAFDDQDVFKENEYSTGSVSKTSIYSAFSFN